MIFEQPIVYAAIHNDDLIRSRSRSGGVFTALSDKVLDEEGVVYGCVLNDELKAVHIRATNKSKRDQMRGSKYIQSRLGETYRLVKNDLLEGRFVLFSGTSCQVHGLKLFLQKEYDNLLCIDIVCHGVPSQKVWSAYVQWQEKNYHSKVVNADFRDKNKYGWREHVETLYFANGVSVNSRIFKTLFYKHQVLRPSCYECKYKSIIHPGDITIADYWGIEKAAPELDDNRGVSLVLINNEKGENFFENIKFKLKYKKTKIEDSMQPPLRAPFPKPKNRNEFWDDFNKNKFSYIVKKYGDYNMRHYIKDKLHYIKNIIKLKVGDA